MFQIGTPRYVHSLNKIRAVAHVQSPQQDVIAQVQVRQIGIAVGITGVSQFERLQLGGKRKLCITYHKPRQVSHIFEL